MGFSQVKSRKAFLTHAPGCRREKAQKASDNSNNFGAMRKLAFRVKPNKHPTLKFLVRSKVTGKWTRKFFRTRG
jgi:hypothetical protein